MRSMLKGELSVSNLQKSRKKFWILSLTGGLIVISVFLFAFAGCGKKEPGQVEAGEKEKALSVKTENAQVRRIAEVTRVPVTIKAAQETNLSFELGGRVVEVRVDLGDQVNKGDLLLRLDETNIQNQIKQAQTALAVAEANLASLKAGSRPENIQISQAQLKQAEANLELQTKNMERMKKLYEQELIAKQQYDSAVAAYNSALAQARVAKESLSLAEQGASKEALEVAEAQVKQAAVGLEIAESQLDKTRLTAPFSGSVMMVGISAGEMASPGLPVVGLADLRQVKAVGYVGQSLINNLAVGDPVSVSVRTNGEKAEINGKIAVLSSTVDSRLKTYEFQIAMENGSDQLKGGMVGEAFFVVRQSAAENPVIPREAIMEYSGERIVYAVEEGRAVAKTVTLGVDDGQSVEIISGLETEAQVVTSGQHQLKDGVKVEVK